MAIDLFDELMALAERLAAEEIPYALCGGLALAVHGVPRATIDIDLLVQRRDVERIRAVARAGGYQVETEQRFLSGLELFRSAKIVGEETLLLDLLVATADDEPVWSERERIEVEGRSIWVVSRAGLERMKLAAGREQDLADLRRLAELDG